MQNTIPEVDAYIDEAADFAQPILTRYIEEAVLLNEQGVKIPRPKLNKAEKEIVIPEYFMAAIGRSKKALATFQNFSYSNRRDYVEWVTVAKREATRDQRLATAVDWMSQGKPRNWKYMKDWR